MQKLLVLTWLCILVTVKLEAQYSEPVSIQHTSPIIFGKAIVIKSVILAEERTLNIYTPENYITDSTSRFPVIYLLDGSTNEDFVHVCGIVQFLTMSGLMPQTIVVGIANVDRRRDFTFPTTIAKDKADYPTTGRSEQFMSFLEKELLPFIKHSYRTNDTSIIIGQSLGGLLATEILFRKTALFNNYIIVSPSLWWDNESLLQHANLPREVKAKDSLRIYITVGKEGKQMENDAARLAAVVKKNSSAGTVLNFQPLPKENHLTILHQAVYAALVWRFRK